VSEAKMQQNFTSKQLQILPEKISVMPYIVMWKVFIQQPK
jgi:hypothetical protein